MYRSFDPYHRHLIAEYPAVDRINPEPVIGGFSTWSSWTVEQRVACFRGLAEQMASALESLAATITLEMGKPIREAEAELRKCISTTEHFCSVAPDLLQPKAVRSEASASYVIPAPLGPILAVMPWNFPFWQVIRFAVPAMLAGNTVVLKHAPNVPQCALKLELLFRESGFPPGSFTNHFLTDAGVAELIAAPFMAGLTFTGSDTTGSILAALAGKHLKKAAMELGGNDPMIVLNDADPKTAAASALQSRCINGGQACNGAKRFLVDQSIHDEFIRELSNQIATLKVGDPMDPATHIGPIARLDLFEKVQRQVNATVAEGATLVHQSMDIPAGSWCYPPTVLSRVQPGMTAFEEEIFGPVWSVTGFQTLEEAVALANASKYGLGASVWTNDESILHRVIPQLETGMVFINDFVRSDPRFPFGGVKRSGFGKELGEAGLFEFVNWKTVWRR